ncbi:flagellar motor switch protein FliN [Buchnera aphidicola]|uniref:flagellar motor switch protein FliN n=1 Tax=Buchnera aphidicola TaxID=9 RepID=UPI003464057D
MNKIKNKDVSNNLDNDYSKKNDGSTVDINSAIKEKNETKKLNNMNESLDNKKTIVNVPLKIRVELGKSKIKIKDLLSFSKGSVFFLNKKKEDPLKIFINNKLIALGEIVVSDNKYGIRIISINNSLNSINI